VDWKTLFDTLQAGSAWVEFLRFYFEGLGRWLIAAVLTAASVFTFGHIVIIGRLEDPDHEPGEGQPLGDKRAGVKLYLRLGWIAGGRYNNPVQRGLSDYRAWSCFLATFVGFFLFWGMFVYTLTPDGLIASLDASTPWALSPAGVTLLLNRIWTFLWMMVLLMLTSVLSAVLIRLDPLPPKGAAVQGASDQANGEASLAPQELGVGGQAIPLTPIESAGAAGEEGKKTGEATVVPQPDGGNGKVHLESAPETRETRVRREEAITPVHQAGKQAAPEEEAGPTFFLLLEHILESESIAIVLDGTEWCVGDWRQIHAKHIYIYSDGRRVQTSPTTVESDKGQENAVIDYEEGQLAGYVAGRDRWRTEPRFGVDPQRKRERVGPGEYFWVENIRFLFRLSPPGEETPSTVESKKVTAHTQQGGGTE
jgi:hypothetical protein